MIKVTEITGELHEWTPWTPWRSWGQPKGKLAKPSGSSRRRRLYVGQLHIASILEFRCDGNFDCACCAASFYRVIGAPFLRFNYFTTKYPTFEQALKRLQELVG